MLTLIHLITIPVDNTSVNPARSIATAVVQHGWALEQVWVFIVFPVLGGLLGGYAWKTLVTPEDA
jgi:aquaporin Z